MEIHAHFEPNAASIQNTSEQIKLDLTFSANRTLKKHEPKPNNTINKT